MTPREAILAVALICLVVCSGAAAQWSPNPRCSDTWPVDDVIRMPWHRHPSLAFRHHPSHGLITRHAHHMFPHLWDTSLMHDIDMFTGFPSLFNCPIHQDTIYQKQDYDPYGQYCQDDRQADPDVKDRAARRASPGAIHRQQQEREERQQEEEMEEMIQREDCKDFGKAEKTSPLHAVLDETENQRKVEEDGRRSVNVEHQRREEEKRRQLKLQQEKLAAERREWEKIKEQREEQLREREEQLKRNVPQQRTGQRQHNREESMQQRPQTRQQSQHNPRGPTTQHKIPSAPMSEVVTLQVNGYYPEDLKVRTEGSQLIISGKHTCGCEELCFEKEFERLYPVPRGVDTRSLRATLHSDGQLKVEGQKYRGGAQQDDVRVEVEGVGVGLRSQVEDPTCGGRKSGFKLRKIARHRPSSVAAEESFRFEKYQDEEDSDGVTIEVVEE